MRILGIDPGTSVTGFGVVERRPAGIAHVVHGTLRPPRSAPLCERLAFLHSGLLAVAREHAPDAAVVEQVFVASGIRSALVLGQARGALIAALGAAGLPVSELSAAQIKQAVTSTGAASKTQVQAMVARLLDLDARPASDAADALAAAIAAARAQGLPGRTSQRRRRRARSRLAVRRLL
jgi:crossover junction endodeoxyribonuclease RuvC